MEKLLQDLDAIVDLSQSETKQIVTVFKNFVESNFHVDTAALNRVFEMQESVVLNQQEDEDNLHAQYGSFMYSYA